MAITAIIAVVTIAAGIFYVLRSGAPVRLHMLLAMSLGIGLTILLAGALMGLLFVSSRSGHDESVADDSNDHFP